MNRAERLLDAGQYEKALVVYDWIAADFPTEPPGDTALFRMGMIWAHPENPNHDYKRAQEYFQRLASRFPAAGLGEEDRVLIGLVDELVRCDASIERQEKALNGLRKQLDDMKKIDIGIEEKRKNFLKQ